VLTAVLAAALVSVAVGAGADRANAVPTIGTLTQQPDPNGCFVDPSKPTSGCTTASALVGPSPFAGSHSIVVSNDGRNVYAVSSTSNAVVVFDRDTTTGSLTQKPGTAGCISQIPNTGCAQGRALLRPTSIDMSGDGRSVYVASFLSQGVAVFDRDVSDGALTQKVGLAGCITNSPRPTCMTGRALKGPFAVAVSPAGDSVYINDFAGDGIAVFDRSAATGDLTQKSGPAGCVVNTPTSGCTTGVGLNGPEDQR